MNSNSDFNYTNFPVLRVEISGEVRASNLAEFESAAMSLIGSVKTELVTDQDFADAEKAVKSFDKAEKELKAKKQQALEQTASIDELFKTVDRIGELMRDKRLLLTRTVKAEKENRKAQIVQNAKRAYRDWLDAQDSPIAIGDEDFNPAETMKGKKTISSLQSAADDAMAAAKISATQQIELYRSNLKIMEASIGNHRFLFSDWKQLIAKQPDDLHATITARIAEHDKREAERLELERQRIQAEEEAKARAEAERIRREEQAKVEAETERLQLEERQRLQQDQSRALAEQSKAQQAVVTDAHPGHASNEPIEPVRRQVEPIQSEMVTIERREHEYLLKAAEKLHRLEAWGVDKWDGYDDAMSDIDD